MFFCCFFFTYPSLVFKSPSVKFFNPLRPTSQSVCPSLVYLNLDSRWSSEALQKRPDCGLFAFYFPYVGRLAWRRPGSSSCHSPARTGPAGWRRAAGTVGTGRDRRTARSARRSLKEGGKKGRRSEADLTGEQDPCGARKDLPRKCGRRTAI